jgi:hypothetical protein
MNYHKLRIAWSVGCGILCLLLIALWVRSYGNSDFIIGLGWDGHSWLESSSGLLALGSTPEQSRGQRAPPLGFVTCQIVATEHFIAPRRVDYFRTPRGNTWLLPVWMLIAAVATLGSCPWLPLRFSLCTLLITTTLVAVLLGLLDTL